MYITLLSLYTLVLIRIIIANLNFNPFAPEYEPNRDKTEYFNLRFVRVGVWKLYWQVYVVNSSA